MQFNDLNTLSSRTPGVHTHQKCLYFSRFTKQTDLSKTCANIVQMENCAQFYPKSYSHGIVLHSNVSQQKLAYLFRSSIFAREA